MQLDDVREQLHDLAERVPDGSISIDEVFVRTRRTASRRRVVRGVVSLVLVGLVVSAGVVIGVSRPLGQGARHCFRADDNQTRTAGLVAHRPATARARRHRRPDGLVTRRRGRRTSVGTERMDR